MEKVDEVIYSDLFKRIHSKEVLKVLESTIPIQKGNRSSDASRELNKQDTPAFKSRGSKANNIPYKIEEIVDALLFDNSNLSTEKIFCLFIIAKENFIKRINRKPATFNFNTLEEHTNTNERQRSLDYGRISFLGVDSHSINESSIWSQHTQRSSSQSAQRSSISLEDTEASFDDKLEYMVDYILEILLVTYPEKLRMVLELEQCLSMNRNLLSRPKNVLFMEAVLGNRLRFQSLDGTNERVLYTRKFKKSDDSNLEEEMKSGKTSKLSFLKNYSNRLIPDSTEIPANWVSNSPLQYLRNVLESKPADLKAKLKDKLVDFVTNNVQTRARFYRTPSGRGFAKEPILNSGLLRTVVLKVEDEPQERTKLSNLNFSKLSKRSKGRFFEINTDKVTTKSRYEIDHEFPTEIGQSRRRNKSIAQELKNDRSIKYGLHQSLSILNPIR